MNETMGLWYDREFGRKDQFILIVESNGRLEPASRPRVYKSEEQARAVAQSMAEKNPGSKFYIFKAVGEAEAPVEPRNFVSMY
jgi:hypothetical protein